MTIYKKNLGRVQGVGLDYKIEDGKLFVKKEDEESYSDDAYLEMPTLDLSSLVSDIVIDEETGDINLIFHDS